MIRVAISGSGNMGRQVRAAVDAEPDMEAVGFIDALAEPGECDGLTRLAQPDDLFDIRHPDVVVDFSNAAFTPQLAEAALKRGVRPVIGTSGLTPDFVVGLESQCAEKKLGGVVAANFALGAVLMMHFAAQAARFYESAEVIELHHDKKVDAPSGTAVQTARSMFEQRGKDFVRNVPERENLPGARTTAESGVTIHSVRLPGLLAHQEVLLGGSGELLTIRHDTLSRESFMPGVLMAVRRSMELDHLVVGLDRLMGLA
ncbi:MAG TPA: 4-hydroxy-tetrahydrodipicolinate reductase [Dehalococcoidia bacterium]|nr:4-hydroxy-tetrahydrodipicolinate reductase [Dehalococcoidia bacterium]